MPRRPSAKNCNASIIPFTFQALLVLVTRVSRASDEPLRDGRILLLVLLAPAAQRHAAVDQIVTGPLHPPSVLRFCRLIVRADDVESCPADSLRLRRQTRRELLSCCTYAPPLPPLPSSGRRPCPRAMRPSPRAFAVRAQGPRRRRSIARLARSPPSSPCLASAGCLWCLRADGGARRALKRSGGWEWGHRS